MTITTATPTYVQIPGNGSATTFAFPFKVFQSTDVVVGFITSSGYSQQTGGYGVTNIDNNGGGNVVFTIPPPIGVTVDIRSLTPQTQSTEFANLGAYLPENSTEAMDRVTRVVQDLYRLTYIFGFHGPDQESVPWTTLPSATARANALLGFDGNGLPTIAVPLQNALTQSTFNALLGLSTLYPATPAEIGAGVTIINYQLPQQTATRYATNSDPGTTPMDAGIQAGIDSATSASPEVSITDENALSKPILLRSAGSPTPTVENISLIGTGRVSTILVPLAANIATVAQGVNAFIINQNNNTHLHLKSLRVGPDSTAYTGIFLYATEGGCTDGSGQALFSAVVDDVWFSLSSNNSGYFRGGFSNLRVSKCVFENTKTGCFRLEGAGNGDQQYIGNVMNQCFDSFVYGNDDTLTKAVISVIGLHAYSHLRGPLISITKGVEMMFQNIILEPATVNFGTTGLFQFTDCTDVLCTKFFATTANGEPKCAIGINLINSFTGKFADGKICGTVGIQVSGTGTLDLTVDNVDFIGCDTAFQMLSGNLGGVVYFRKCRLNNNQLYALIILAGTASFDLTVEDCEILNCGLNGVVTTRNMDLTTSGAVTVVRCKFGQNNGAAVAANYIRADGTGVFTVINPTIVGTPPTALVDATSSQAVNFIWTSGYGGVLAAATTLTLPNSGDVFDVSGSGSITSIIATNQQGRRITLTFEGAVTVTDGGNLLLAGNFVTTSQDSLTLVCVGTNWYEASRSVN